MIGPAGVSVKFTASYPDYVLPPFISGSVVDLSGAAIAGANVFVFDTLTNLPVGTTTSNSDGTYSCLVPDRSKNYYVVAYLPGSPDRAGTTVDTLTGV